MIMLVSLSVFLSNITYATEIVNEAANSSVATKDSLRNQTKEQIGSAAQVIENKNLNTPIANDQELPLPATGWLLFFSLIGFVLLSNRQNI